MRSAFLANVCILQYFTLPNLEFYLYIYMTYNIHLAPPPGENFCGHPLMRLRTDMVTKFINISTNLQE